MEQKKKKRRQPLDTQMIQALEQYEMESLKQTEQCEKNMVPSAEFYAGLEKILESIK